MLNALKKRIVAQALFRSEWRIVAKSQETFGYLLFKILNENLMRFYYDKIVGSANC